MSKKVENEGNGKKPNFENEYVVFDKQVRAQTGTIHKVVSNGTTIEYTDRVSESAAAYKDATRPKELWHVEPNGTATLIQRQAY